EPQDQADDQALEARLVELAGVTREGFAGQLLAVVHVVNDAPRDVGRMTPQLAIHEIGDAPEEQAEGDAAGDIVMDAQPVELVLAAQPQDRQGHAEHAAVEGHAAFPQLQQFQRL
ncbi:hypothetical protein VF05_32585, partial [Nostoc linckia z3]